jgi:hypothetical protein
MTNLPAARTAAMTTIDCPLCDGPARLDDTEVALDCPACAVRIELAADPGPADLPAAA